MYAFLGWPWQLYFLSDWLYQKAKKKRQQKYNQKNEANKKQKSKEPMKPKMKRNTNATKY